MKVNKKTIPLLVIALLSLFIGVTIIAEAVTGGWIFNQTLPTAPDTGYVEYLFQTTELIEFLQIDVTLSGTGEVGTIHTVDYTITNIAQNGETILSGSYHIGFDDYDPLTSDLVASGSLDGLAPTQFITGSEVWTPTLILEYRCFAGVFNVVWI